MLTNKDLEQIDRIVKDPFTDFIDHLFIPHLDQSHKEHQEILSKIDTIHEHLSDHEKRISKLEAISSL